MESLFMELQQFRAWILIIIGIACASLFFQPLKRHMIFERDKAIVKAKSITLNQTLPSFQDLVKFIKRDQGSFLDERYIQYYEKVTNFFPQIAEAEGLLGFCYYHNGNLDQAILHFQKAIDLNPRFFWHYYNLGVIYSQSGRYQLANELLKRAVALRPEETIKALYRSKIYQQILSEWQGGAPDLIGQLKSGYIQAVQMIIANHYQLAHYSEMLFFTQQALSTGWDQRGEFSYWAGLAAFKMQDFEEALRYFQESLDKNSQNKKAAYQAGLCLRELGREDSAKKILQSSEGVLPDDSLNTKEIYQMQVL